MVLEHKEITDESALLGHREITDESALLGHREITDESVLLGHIQRDSESPLSAIQYGSYLARCGCFCILNCPAVSPAIITVIRLLS